MEKMNDLRDLLKHEIDDLYSVEEQIIEALPKMIEKANNKTLKTSLSEHLTITEEHKARLDKIRTMLNKDVEQEGQKKKGFLSGILGGSHVCKGMKGIIEEGNKVMGEDMTPEVLDAAIIACAQKVEHYEICGYGTARTYARELKLEPLAKLLEQTLAEEYEADDKLTELAISRVNLKAESTGGKSGDSSASGSNQRGAVGSRERVNAKEEQMEPVSSRNSSTRKTSTTSAAGQPKASGSVPRSTTGRGSAAKKSSGGRATKASAKSSDRSARSSSNGRSNGGRSSARGRK
jgi:ferritin-like metal-binding protein YciE